MPYFCTGFLALRATPRTEAMLKKWHLNLDGESCNQKPFQKAVHESNANGRTLPMTFFPNGEIFFEQMPKQLRKEVVVVHNNFIKGKEKKIQRFKYFGLWHYNEGTG